MMKSLLTTAALVAGLAVVAGDASAKSAAYCSQVANNYVQNYTHPVGAAVVGCGLGALAGQLLSNGNGGAVAGGCALGAGGGLVLSNARRTELYNQAFNQCMYGGGGGAQPIGSGPMPSGFDGGYEIGSSGWMQACGYKYNSFQWTGPHAGQFKGFDGQWHWCDLPG